MCSLQKRVRSPGAGVRNSVNHLMWVLSNEFFLMTLTGKVGALTAINCRLENTVQGIGMGREMRESYSGVPSGLI